MRVVTVAERRDLVEAMWHLPTSWPEFMLHDPVADRWFGQLPDRFPGLQLVAVEDAGGPERVVGKAHAVAFAWSGEPADLPRGWDGVLEQAMQDADLGLAPTAASLLEIAVDPERQGRGISSALLAAAQTAARAAGFGDLFGPVRPTGKPAHPDVPMREYVLRRRPDGLPQDPWMRVHARVGAQVVGVCPVSMTIPGTLAQWRAWTGLPLDRSGDVTVPGALVPVHVSVEHDHAVYVEPNVWMRHSLRA